MTKENRNIPGEVAALRSTMPWKHTCFGEHSEIEAQIDNAGEWHTIAKVRPIAGLDAEEIAGAITAAVNARHSGEKG